MVVAWEGALPPVAVLLVLPPDSNGDLFARPLEDTGEEGPEDTPRILILPQKGDPALAAGMKILARLTPVGGEDHGYQARLIRRVTAATCGATHTSVSETVVLRFLF